MLTENLYGVSHKYLPDTICDDVVRRAKELQTEEGCVGSVGVDKKTRDSRLVWLSDPWIYDWITPAVRELNSFLKWNFDILFPENIQFTKYSENQFYNWHTDSTPKDEFNTRKISVVIPLVDSDQYEGGNLELFDYAFKPDSKKEERIVSREDFRQKGNMILFPSYVWHRVTKITKGERLSMVIWYRGEKFK